MIGYKMNKWGDIYSRKRYAHVIVVPRLLCNKEISNPNFKDETNCIWPSLPSFTRCSTDSAKKYQIFEENAGNVPQLDGI